MRSLCIFILTRDFSKFVPKLNEEERPGPCGAVPCPPTPAAQWSCAVQVRYSLLKTKRDEQPNWHRLHSLELPPPNVNADKKKRSKVNL